jgi:hypothetical protein
MGQGKLDQAIDGHNHGDAYDGERSNGLRFSCRRGVLHQKALKCQRSRAPKAVSCKRVLGGSVGELP